MTNCLFTAHANAVFNAFFWLVWLGDVRRTIKQKPVAPTNRTYRCVIVHGRWNYYDHRVGSFPCASCRLFTALLVIGIWLPPNAPAKRREVREKWRSQEHPSPTEGSRNWWPTVYVCVCVGGTILWNHVMWSFFRFHVGSRLMRWIVSVGCFTIYSLCLCFVNTHNLALMLRKKRSSKILLMRHATECDTRGGLPGSRMNLHEWMASIGKKARRERVTTLWKWFALWRLMLRQ